MTQPERPCPSPPAQTDQDEPETVPAATVVIFRRAALPGLPPEILMVQRAKAMRFAGGAAVFPGGRIDPADRDLARQLMPAEPEALGCARIAAIRETLEETGLLIACRTPVTPQAVREGREHLAREGALAPVLSRMGWDLAPERLTYFAHWCPNQARAFDTRFFVIDLGRGEVDIAVDATENTQLFWTSARQALEQAASGTLRVIFPTLRNLERLALYANYEEALADIARHPPRRITPRVEPRSDGDWLVIPEGLGYPICAQPLATARRG